MARRRRRGQERSIARERIDILFTEALKAALAGNAARANRYVELARRIGMRYNVRIPQAHRRRFCKVCYAYLLPGRTATVRVGSGRVVAHCHACGATMRVPHLRETKAKRMVAKGVRRSRS